MVYPDQFLPFVLDAAEGRDLALGIHAKPGRALQDIVYGEGHADPAVPSGEQPASLLGEASIDVVLHPLPAA
jgi:hypothetical protein